MKSLEVQREKIAGKLEDVMCRCRRAKAEEPYVEYSSCSNAENDFSWLHACCTGFSRLSATSFRDWELKCAVCIIRGGFKGDLELGDSGLTTVSSNDNNDKNVLEGIERISIVVKSLVGNMADMKNQYESVASTGAMSPSILQR